MIAPVSLTLMPFAYTTTTRRRQLTMLALAFSYIHTLPMMQSAELLAVSTHSHGSAACVHRRRTQTREAVASGVRRVFSVTSNTRNILASQSSVLFCRRIGPVGFSLLSVVVLLCCAGSVCVCVGLLGFLSKFKYAQSSLRLSHLIDPSRFRVKLVCIV